MNNLRALSFILIVMFLLGCQKEIVIPCQKTGFTDEPVCPVSFFQALGSTNYDKRVIRIAGFIRTRQIGGSPKTFLYFSEEQANIQNTFGAIEVGQLAGGVKPVRRDAYQKVLSTSQNTYVELIGELTYASTTGMDIAPAQIKNLVGVRVVPATPRTEKDN